jgi:hypothetical protein
MLSKSFEMDPWAQTLMLLKSLSGHSDVGRMPRSSASKARSSARHYGGSLTPPNFTSAKVKIIDRPSSTTATIQWCDNTCFYGDQSWRLAVAKHSGECALTGNPIRVGDLIYRPRISSAIPSNAKAMILSSCVQRLEIGNIAASRGGCSDGYAGPSDMV